MLSFYVKFWTDRETDKEKTIKQYAPNLLIRGIKITGKQRKNQIFEFLPNDKNVDLSKFNPSFHIMLILTH